MKKQIIAAMLIGLIISNPHVTFAKDMADQELNAEVTEEEVHQSFVYCAAHNVVAGMKFGEGTRELSASKELVDIFLRAAYLSQGDQDEAATNKQFDSVVKDFKEEIATQDKDVLEDIKQLDEVCAQLSDFAVKLIDDAKARKQDADEMEIDEEALTNAT